MYVYNDTATEIEIERWRWSRSLFSGAYHKQNFSRTLTTEDQEWFNEEDPAWQLRYENSDSVVYNVSIARRESTGELSRELGWRDAYAFYAEGSTLQFFCSPDGFTNRRSTNADTTPGVIPRSNTTEGFYDMPTTDAEMGITDDPAGNADRQTSSSQTSLQVGIAVGVVTLIVIAVIVILAIYISRRKMQQKPQLNPTVHYRADHNATNGSKTEENVYSLETEYTSQPQESYEYIEETNADQTNVNKDGDYVYARNVGERRPMIPPATGMVENDVYEGGDVSTSAMYDVYTGSQPANQNEAEPAPETTLLKEEPKAANEGRVYDFYAGTATENNVVKTEKIDSDEEVIMTENDVYSSQ